MPEHVTEWLNAFLDGELHGPRLKQVQEHLAGCAICQADLEDLQKLSQMLHEAAPVRADRPSDRFIAELVLILPRREAGASSPRDIGWWLVPAGAAASWALLQAGLTLGGLLSTAGAAGLLDGASGWFSSAPEHTEWFSAALGLFGGHLAGNGFAILNVMDNLGVLGSNLTSQLAWQAGFALLYWAGLAIWWNRSNRPAGPSSDRRAPLSSVK